MRYAKRTDANHAEIRDGLRAAGYLVLDLSACGQGVPDLAVMVEVGRSLFLEVKDGTKPPSAQELTDAEKEWFKFNAEVSRCVNSLEMALRVVEKFKSMSVD